MEVMQKHKDKGETAAKDAEEEGYDSGLEVADEELDQWAQGAPMGEAKPKDPAQKGKGKRHRQEVDTNIVSISAAYLDEQGAYATGDPFYCSSCQAIFNKSSKAITEPAGKIWVCEFCGTRNELPLEEEEYPISDQMTYILEGKGAGKAVLGTHPDVSVIFCVDLSGSMDGSQHYKGDKMKYMTSPYFVTRLQCVKMAIDKQLTAMHSSPSTQQNKVGFVTFDNVVTLLGDRTDSGKVYADKQLSDYAFLFEDATKLAPTSLAKPLHASYASLLKTLGGLKTAGQTALGPALLVSLALAAQGKPGSKIVLCTDGLANKGLGTLDVPEKDLEASKAFYTKIADIAKDKGITISVITLVEEGCRLDVLSPIANCTGGDLLRVNPINLGKDYAMLGSQEVIATNVVVRAILHKALRFRNEEERFLSASKTMLTKDIGNATKNTTITYEYAVKPLNELLAQQIDLQQLLTVPFQSQITYKDREGKKCLRVVSQVQEVTHEKDDAIKDVNKAILGAHVAHKAAEMADKGAFREAQAHVFNYAQLARGDQAVAQAAMPLVQALEQEQLANDAQHIAAPNVKSDKLAAAINQAYMM